MNTSNTSHPAMPIRGILSLPLSPLGLLLVICFASGAGRGITHPRVVIVFAQYLLLALLGSGLVSGLAGIVRHEQPAWLVRTGMILTIYITGLIALFFYSLDN